MGWRDLVKTVYDPTQGAESAIQPPSGSSARRSDWTGVTPIRTPSVPSVSPVSTMSSRADTVNQEYYEEIRKEFSKAPTPEFEEFLGSLNDLQQDIPDEGKRISAALRIAARSKVTSVQLVTAAQQRLNIVKSEFEQFEKALSDEADNLKREKTGMVEGMENDIHAKTSEIEALEQQIAARRSEIATLSTKRDAVAGEIASIDKRRDEQIEQFRSAHDAHVQELSSIKTKLQNQRS